MIEISTFCSGIGAAEQAMKDLQVEHKVKFAAEIDKYARTTYTANHHAELMIHDMCEPDYIGQQYYSDINVSGLPCQAFSLAGKRLGELDNRGLLFYDFYRWVKNQQPKVFIIENVKGLLSDNKGKTFQNWLLLLGRSVNSHEQMFIHPDSLEYNLHYTVLNSKNFGVPQNRERVFIVGIRKDLPNDFRFPIGWKLDKRLRDVLEKDVDEKYYLSEKMQSYLINRSDNFNSGKINLKNENSIASTVTTGVGQTDVSDNIIEVCKINSSQVGKVFSINGISQCLSSGNNNSPKIVVKNLGFINQDTQASQVYGVDGVSPTLSAGTHGYALGYVLVKEATKKGFDIAEIGDSINMSNPNSTTRRGRVGKGIANTLDTACNQVVVEPQIFQTPRGFNKGGLHDICPPITSNSFENNNHLIEPELVQIAQIEGFESEGRVYDSEGIARTIKNGGGGGSKTGWYNVEENNKILNDSEKQIGITHTQVDTNKLVSRIRRLTPLECFRLQAFPDEFFYKAKYESKEFSKELLLKNPKHKGKRIFSDEERIERMSDSQLYKQAGNSITVHVIKSIIANLLHLLK